MDTLEGLDEESFDVHFSERTWSVTLSDGSNFELRDNGASESVRYEDRLEYAKLAKQARMSESDKQVNILQLQVTDDVEIIMMWILDIISLVVPFYKHVKAKPDSFAIMNFQTM